MGLMIDLQPGHGRALVIGGGAVAERKVLALAEAEFEVTVVAPDVTERIRLAPYVTVAERAWEPADLDAPGIGLVFACTNERATNKAIGAAARRKGLLVLVADAQGESTFFSPATIRDGDLQLAVSTGGASPALAKELRTRIAEALGPGWGRVTYAARAEREKRLGREPSYPLTREQYEAMLRELMESSGGEA